MVVHAEFVSPNSFYDAAAFQEEIIEAFRLLGLVGFAALIILNDSIVGPWVSLNSALDTSDTPTLIAIAVWQNVCVRQRIDLQSGRVRVAGVRGILALRSLPLWKMERHVDLRRLHGAVLDAFNAGHALPYIHQ